LHLSALLPKQIRLSGIAVSVLSIAALAAQGTNVGAGFPADDSGFRQRLRSRAFTSAEILKSFDSPPDESYRLGDGDEISIDVWARPELTGKHQVGPDGRITMPLVGSMVIKDMTREEAAKAIASAYTNIYTNLSVSLRVDRYTSNRIYILGRVATPGLVHFDGSMTLLEAITRAGSLPVGGVGSEKAALTRCAVFRGRDQMAWIDLRSLMTGANLALNLRLRRDDIIYVPDADDQMVYVLGEVKTPGALHLTADMSLLDALSKAGGPTEDASTAKIHVVRPSKELDREFRLRDLLSPDPALNFALEEGDIIYMPKRRTGSVGYFLQKLGSISGLVVMGGALSK